MTTSPSDVCGVSALVFGVPTWAATERLHLELPTLVRWARVCYSPTSYATAAVRLHTGGLERWYVGKVDGRLVLLWRVQVKSPPYVSARARLRAALEAYR
jgi:hypothetical protein